MRTLVRLVGAVLATALCSGCGLAWTFEDPPPVPTARPTSPVEPPQPAEETTPEPVPEPAAYTGELARGAKCATLDKESLTRFEEMTAVGGAITYSRGAMVKANGDWWTVALSTQVNPNSEGLTSGNVEPSVHLITTVASLAKDAEVIPVTRRVSTNAGGKALEKAIACLKKVPLPKPKPPAGSPETYTGKLARGASCKAVPAAMLDHLHGVGQVGGAITYPRGQMVRANGKWWTVAVATKVNPNSAGVTPENTPKTALFVTNDPSFKATTTARIVYFPLKPGKRDTAAARALKCLAGS